MGSPPWKEEKNNIIGHETKREREKKKILLGSNAKKER